MVHGRQSAKIIIELLNDLILLDYKAKSGMIVEKAPHLI